MAGVKSTYSTYTDLHETLPGLVANMQIVDTTGLPLEDSSHWSSAGYVALGSLMAAL